MEVFKYQDNKEKNVSGLDQVLKLDKYYLKRTIIYDMTFLLLLTLSQKAVYEKSTPWFRSL